MADAPRVLLTGAAGVVGRAASAALHAAGVDVMPVARAPIAGGHAIDLTGRFGDGLAKLGAGDRPRTILHLAAAVPSARYPDAPETAALTRAIDRHVLEAATAWGAQVVYASGCSLYDRADPGFKTPASPLATGLSPYLQAKHDGERAFGEIGATVIRLSGPVGPGLPRGVVMKRFVDLARADAVLEIWGTGSREQDFIHVDDAAALLVAAAADPAPGIHNGARGEPTTMDVLAHAVVDVVGSGRVRRADRDDPCEGENARYSIAATRARFGWAPRRTLADMIRSAAEQ